MTGVGGMKLDDGSEVSTPVWPHGQSSQGMQGALILGLCVSLFSLHNGDSSEWPALSSAAVWTTPSAVWTTPLPMQTWEPFPSFPHFEWEQQQPQYFCLVMLALFAWASWESTKFPRLVSAGTPWKALRMVMQFVGDLGLVPFLTFLPGEKPDVRYQQTRANQRIIDACPSFDYFKQSTLLRNSSLAFFMLMVRDFMGNDTNLVRRERLTAKDGGIVAVDWWVKTEVPSDAKILFIGSTLTGDAVNRVTRDLCRHYSARGWRCVTMVKRGCGLTMPNVQPPGTKGFWCLSGFDDISLAIDHVAAAYPGVPICGIGLSTGGGQLRNYVNSMGSRSKIAACVVVDAATSWAEALQGCDQRIPHISRVLFQAIAAGLEPCGHASSDVLSKAQSSGNFLGLFAAAQEILGPLNGYPRTEEGALEYMRHCQPAPAKGCRRPLLEMMSFNDTLVDVPAIRQLQDLHLESPHTLTCATQGGTHCIRWEGWRARCWLSRASCEFLEAALKESTAVY